MNMQFLLVCSTKIQEHCLVGSHVKREREGGGGGGGGEPL